MKDFFAGRNIKRILAGLLFYFFAVMSVALIVRDGFTSWKLIGAVAFTIFGTGFLRQSKLYK